jgi:transcriptional regulator with XRE-family HTH domain
MNFPKILVELRKERELSQKKLAELTELSQSNLAKYELGKIEPSASALIKLSNYFNISIDYLLGRDGITANATVINRTNDSKNEKEEIQTIKKLLEKAIKLLDKE